MCDLYPTDYQHTHHADVYLHSYMCMCDIIFLVCLLNLQNLVARVAKSSAKSLFYYMQVRLVSKLLGRQRAPTSGSHSHALVPA